MIWPTKQLIKMYSIFRPVHLRGNRPKGLTDSQFKAMCRDETYHKLMVLDALPKKALKSSESERD